MYTYTVTCLYKLPKIKKENQLQFLEICSDFSSDPISETLFYIDDHLKNNNFRGTQDSKMKVCFEKNNFYIRILLLNKEQKDFSLLEKIYDVEFFSSLFIWCDGATFIDNMNEIGQEWNDTQEVEKIIYECHYISNNKCQEHEDIYDEYESNYAYMNGYGTYKIIVDSKIIFSNFANPM